MMKKEISLWAFLTGVLFVSGCAVSTDQPPRLPDELGKITDSALYPVDENWWLLYEDENLNKLLETAMKNNPDYLKAVLTVRRELYNLRLVQSDLFPTLSGSLGASAQRQIDRHDSFSNNFTGELGLKYELDLYGKIDDTVKAQAFEYEATVMDRDSARLILINSVVDLYFNLVYLDNSIKLSEKNIRAYQKIEQIMATKYKSGKSDHVEVLEAKQSVLTERNKLLDLQTKFREMENSLKNIIGMREGQPDIQYDDLLKQKTLGVNTDVPLAVLAARPDLRAEQYRLEKAFKDLNAMEKSWYPDISLSGSFGSSASKARKTFDFPYILGKVSVDLPFLDWNRVKNNVKISRTDYEIALVGFRDALTQAVNEVAYYSFAYGQSLDTFKNIEENYQTSVQITKYYKTRYDTGKTEFKDYLEAINRENSL
ncbi:MAG: TolC family protein, partial [Alphaproteobacteria bacterium]